LDAQDREEWINTHRSMEDSNDGGAATVRRAAGCPSSLHGRGDRAYSSKARVGTSIRRRRVCVSRVPWQPQEATERLTVPLGSGEDQHRVRVRTQSVLAAAV